jgi:thiol-disulfide isomerase/thioredoxin
MNHQITKLILLLLLIGLSLTVTAQQKLPEFSFTDLKGELFTQEKLDSSLPVIAVFFDPYCDHCEQQAKWIREAEEQFQEVQWLFVSTEEIDAIAEFETKFFTGTSLSHLYFLKDTEYQFDTYFGYSEVPSMYIYNQKWLRVAEFHQETEAAKILENLNK